MTTISFDNESAASILTLDPETAAAKLAHYRALYGNPPILPDPEPQARGPQKGARQEGRRFAFQSAAEIMARPRVPGRIKGLMPDKGVGVIYGDKSTAKSFTAMDLAYSLAAGQDWFGWKVRRPCDVFYIYLESAANLGDRLRALERHRGPIPDKLQFHTGGFNLLEDVDALIRSVPAGAMFFVDTLHVAAPGIDENTAEGMGKVIAAANRLRDEAGAFVMFVHHSGKNLDGGARGHSSLPDDVDLVIEARRDKKTGARSLYLEKCKEGRDGLTYKFKLKVYDLGKDEDGDPITSCAIEPLESLSADEARTRDAEDDARELAEKVAARAREGLEPLTASACGLVLCGWGAQKTKGVLQKAVDLKLLALERKKGRGGGALVKPFPAGGEAEQCQL